MIHLHIGRHKTGTSAVQHFLALNREELARRGYLYPKALDGSAAHHALARTLDQRAPSPGGVVKAAVPEELARFAELAAGPEHLIVSSERFQSVDPQAVRALWPQSQVQVIVYLREPLAYMLSSYAQAIHARCIRTTLVKHAASFRPDYPGFIDRWAGAFGVEAIRVRLYEREQLSHRDVRRDFVDVLGLNPVGLDFRSAEANPSLSPQLIEFKGMVNAVIPLERQTALRLYPVLSRVAAGFHDRVRPGPDFAEAYRRPLRAANARLVGVFGGGQLEPFHEPAPDQPTEPLDLQAVRDTVLEAVRRQSPAVGQALANVLPQDVGGMDPLLPADWSQAGAALQASASIGS